jgi:hypothetical protein
VKRRLYTAFVCSVIFAACGKSDGGNSQDTSQPATASLVSPANNTTCLSGVSVDTGKSTITFSWQSAANADSYDLIVKNLNNAQQNTYAVSGLSKDVVLNKAQPYSWYVVSRSTKTTVTSQSAVWKFYVAGNATTSYAPFPATIIAPAQNAIIPSSGQDSVTVTFQWNATDVDNDIVSYTIYLDEKNATTQVKTVTGNTTTITLAPFKSYYWRVITTDAARNTSDSGIYSFSI